MLPLESRLQVFIDGISENHSVYSSGYISNFLLILLNFSFFIFSFIGARLFYSVIVYAYRMLGLFVPIVLYFFFNFILTLVFSLFFFFFFNWEQFDFRVYKQFARSRENTTKTKGATVSERL